MALTLSRCGSNRRTLESDGSITMHSAVCMYHLEIV